MNDMFRYVHISLFSRFLTEHWPVSLSICTIFVQNSKAIYLFKYWCMRVCVCVSVPAICSEHRVLFNQHRSIFFSTSLSLSLFLSSARQRVTLGEKRATEHRRRKKNWELLFGPDIVCILYVWTMYFSWLEAKWIWTTTTLMMVARPLTIINTEAIWGKMKAKQTSIGRLLLCSRVKQLAQSSDKK